MPVVENIPTTKYSPFRFIANASHSISTRIKTPHVSFQTPASTLLAPPNIGAAAPNTSAQPLVFTPQEQRVNNHRVSGIPDAPVQVVAPATAPAANTTANPTGMNALREYTIPPHIEAAWKMAKNAGASAVKAQQRAYMVDALVQHNLIPAWSVALPLPAYLNLNQDNLARFVTFRREQGVNTLQCLSHLLRAKSRQDLADSEKYWEATQRLYDTDTQGFALALSKAQHLNELDRLAQDANLSAKFKFENDHPATPADLTAASTGQLDFQQGRIQTTQRSVPRSDAPSTSGANNNQPRGNPRTSNRRSNGQGRAPRRDQQRRGEYRRPGFNQDNRPGSGQGNRGGNRGGNPPNARAAPPNNNNNLGRAMAELTRALSQFQLNR